MVRDHGTPTMLHDAHVRNTNVNIYIRRLRTSIEPTTAHYTQQVAKRSSFRLHVSLLIRQSSIVIPTIEQTVRTRDIKCLRMRGTALSLWKGRKWAFIGGKWLFSCAREGSNCTAYARITSSFEPHACCGTKDRIVAMSRVEHSCCHGPGMFLERYSRKLISWVDRTWIVCSSKYTFMPRVTCCLVSVVVLCGSFKQKWTVSL